ncbi:MAG: glycosyltransferase [Desulfobulbaceae bacterium]
MIFVTVGGQMPFDRLIQAVDDWAFTNKGAICFAQIGLGGWRPRNMEWVELLSPPDFREKLENSSLVVAHAGMGTILSALEIGKKLIVVPRRGHLHETRNDHQVATAKRLESMGLVVHAADERLLIEKLKYPDAIEPRRSASAYASTQLLKAVHSFIHETSNIGHSKEHE